MAGKEHYKNEDNLVSSYVEGSDTPQNPVRDLKSLKNPLISVISLKSLLISLISNICKYTC